MAADTAMVGKADKVDGRVILITILNLIAKHYPSTNARHRHRWDPRRTNTLLNGNAQQLDRSTTPATYTLDISTHTLPYAARVATEVSGGETGARGRSAGAGQGCGGRARHTPPPAWLSKMISTVVFMTYFLKLFSRNYAENTFVQCGRDVVRMVLVSSLSEASLWQLSML